MLSLNRTSNAARHLLEQVIWSDPRYYSPCLLFIAFYFPNILRDTAPATKEHLHLESFSGECDEDRTKYVHTYATRGTGKLPVLVCTDKGYSESEVCSELSASWWAASLSLSPQGWSSDKESDLASDPKFSMYVACSQILQVLEAICICHGVSAELTGGVKVHAWAIKHDYQFQQSDHAHNGGSIEVYCAASDRIRCKNGVVLCPADVDGCPDGQRATTSNDYWVLSQPFERAV